MYVHVYGEDQVTKSDSVRQAADDFQKEMKFFETECKLLGNTQLENEVQAINSYLNDNRIKVKGAVVVAPTKELLKYKENDLISKIDVIKAELDDKP